MRIHPPLTRGTEERLQLSHPVGYMNLNSWRICELPARPSRSSLARLSPRLVYRADFARHDSPAVAEEVGFPAKREASRLGLVRPSWEMSFEIPEFGRDFQRP